jgi:hypothetical protein
MINRIQIYGVFATVRDRLEAHRFETAINFETSADFGKCDHDYFKFKRFISKNHGSGRQDKKILKRAMPCITPRGETAGQGY